MNDVIGSDLASANFTQLVRGALAHLYDPSFLQTHALASLLHAEGDLDAVTRAQSLRRALLDCVEALRPQENSQSPGNASRSYVILTYRCIDGLAMEEIAAKLALSRRQAYREHDKGIKAVASLLADSIRKQRRDLDLAAVTGQDSPASRLDIARAEVARLRKAEHVETLDLGEILREITNLVEPLIQDGNTRIKTALTDTQLSIVADRVMLRQALLNLLSHYAAIVDRGELLITISQGENGLIVDIHGVSGSGKAVASQSASSCSAQVNLEVAHALIEAQGGALETYQGNRTCGAKVLLPTPKKTTILVIDDNADLIALLQRYLAGHQASVVGSTDSEEALQLAGKLRPQLIILDIMMPNIDGWEVLQRLRDGPETKNTPLVICSVLNQEQMARAMGANDYITKPVSQVDLLRVLRRWLGILRPGA